MVDQVAIDPEQLADINRDFANLDAGLEAVGKHPTKTTRGSMMVFHADGTRSHFSYRRPMTLAEAEQEPTTPDLRRDESSRRLEKDVIAARKWKRRALWWRLFKRHPGIALHLLRTGKYEPKVISCEKYTHLTCLFVHLLRCKNGCIARYTPIFTPCS